VPLTVEKFRGLGGDGTVYPFWSHMKEGNGGLRLRRVREREGKGEHDKGTLRGSAAAKKGGERERGAGWSKVKGE